MKHLRLWTLLMLSIIIINACKKDEDPESGVTFDLVIENVRLFDGDAVYEQANVFINNGVVAEIDVNNSSRSEVEARIDGSGMTLVPGLIDAHVHLENQGDLRNAALSGVLTLLDAFNFNTDIASQLRQAGYDNPELSYYYSAGIGVTIKDGFVSGGFTDLGIDPISDVAEISSYIQDRVDEGSDFIKIIIDAGGSGSLPVLTDEMIEESIKEAHRHDLLSLVHAGSIDDAVKAAEYGADGIAHIWFRDGEPSPITAIDEIKSKGTFVIPTAYYIQKRYENVGKGMDASVMRTELSKLYTSGVSIVAGTDASRNSSGNIRYGIGFGSGLIDELEVYEEVGIPAVEVLKTATKYPSEFFGLGDKGWIREQASADIVLVDGDPTSDISALRNVKHVWKQGVQIK